MVNKLEDRWKHLWRKLGAVAVPQGIFEELIYAYSASDRSYHNLTHIEDCLSIFDQTRSLAAHPDEV
jgi:predicted metal-dependent HD superfamily phosphohydrolase